MQFADFLDLDHDAVTEIVAEHPSHPLGLAIPFNGTRRWYLAAFDKSSDDLYSDDYPVQVLRRLLAIMGMMFADGIDTIYTPIIGRDLAERGDDYMQFSAAAVASVGSEEALDWYCARGIEARCYGQLELLPPEARQTVLRLPPNQRAPHRLRYGVFADRPLPDIIARTVQLYRATGTEPTAEEVIAHYYDGPVAPVALWIGSDQPTVFDVPLMIHGNTALYFLQFPTLFLDRRTWRRLLYDYLFVRGDQETLHPDNIASHRHITGLGQRQDGYWVPSTT